MPIYMIRSLFSACNPRLWVLRLLRKKQPPLILLNLLWKSSQIFLSLKMRRATSPWYSHVSSHLNRLLCSWCLLFKSTGSAPRSKLLYWSIGPTTSPKTGPALKPPWAKIISHSHDSGSVTGMWRHHKHLTPYPDYIYIFSFFISLLNTSF